MHNLAATSGLASASNSVSGLADRLLGDTAGAASGLLGLAHSLRERERERERENTGLYKRQTSQTQETKASVLPTQPYTHTHTLSLTHTHLLDGSALSAGDLARLADRTADASCDLLGLLGGTASLLGDAASAAVDVLRTR